MNKIPDLMSPALGTMERIKELEYLAIACIKDWALVTYSRKPAFAKVASDT